MDVNDPRGQDDKRNAVDIQTQEEGSWPSLSGLHETLNLENESVGPLGQSIGPLEESVGPLLERSSPRIWQNLPSQRNSVITLCKDEKTSLHSSQETIQSRKSAGDFCRICHDVLSSEIFISPCFCKGSLSQVHKSCLERWLAESDTSQCELCGFKYKIERCPKYSLLMSVVAWMTSRATWRERKNLLVDMLALLILSPIICLSTMMALQLMDSLFAVENGQEKQPKTTNNIVADMSPRRSLEMLGTMMARIGQMGVISMILTMDMAFISWVAMRLQYHVTIWYSWYRRNCKVTLMGYPDQTTDHQLPQVAEPSTSSAVSVQAVEIVE